MKHTNPIFSGRAVVLALVIVLAIMVVPAMAGLVLPQGDSDTTATINAKMLQLPLSFIENRGQAPDAVKFHVAAAGHTISFAPTGVILRTTQEKDGNSVTSEVQMSFEGAADSPGITGIDQLPGKANFFIGADASNWKTDVPTYSAIEYSQLYPGIDLVYKGTEGVLKREFIVFPGADCNQIIISYSGIDSLELAEDGSLLISTPLGVLTDEAPIAYQEIGNRVIPVKVSYRILGDTLAGFTIGAYDPSETLIIDPSLKYSTFLTGSTGSTFKAIAIDSDGNAYVAGSTGLTDFPLMNPIQGTPGGSGDVVVSKINPTGSALLYSTFIGGSLGDAGYGIAVDPARNIYVTGYTQSLNFPTMNPLKATINGSRDIFVIKLNPEGSNFIYSTYLGGNETSNVEYGKSIAADTAGNAYISGLTSAANFPVANAAQNTRAGGYEAVVTKISPDGSSYVFSTYLGGTGDEGTTSVMPEITADSDGNAYVGGWTKSTNFPVLNAYQPATGGGMWDGFITKYNETGSVIFSTYLGGNNTDRIADITIDGSRNIYLTGLSSSINYPTVNPIQALPIGSSSNSIVTKMDASGQLLLFSTFWGNGADEGGKGIAVDPDGNMYILGQGSTTTFPMINPIQNHNNGGPSDFYCYKINSAGTQVLYSTYLGCTAGDTAEGIAADSVGNAYITGSAAKSDYPLKNPLMTFVGTTTMAEGVITVISPLSLPIANFTAAPLTGPYPLTVQFNDTSTNDPTSWSWQFGDGTPNSTDKNPSHIYTAAGNFTVNLTATNSVGSNTVTKTNLINVTIPIPVISVIPNYTTLPAGSTTLYQLLVNTLPAGLSGFNLTVSLDNPAVGEIVALSAPSWAALNGTSTLPADTVTFNAVDLNRQVEPGATNVTLGTVTVRGDIPGATGINVTVRKIDADGGGQIAPVAHNAILNVYIPLVANFSAEPLVGTMPLVVNFTDLSTGNPLPANWSWDFNGDDVIDCTAQNPQFTYATAGHYTVNLTVSNQFDSDTATKSSFIWVKPIVVPFPGYTETPTDPDGDGTYEDVNGNGRLDFDDVVAFYNNMAWITANTEVGVGPYDVNGNGRIDFDDVVLLYYEVL